MEYLLNFARKYNTTVDNISYHKNPDGIMIYYKKAEYDIINGKLIGFYEPTLNNHGYIQLNINSSGPILRLNKTV